MFGLVSNTLLAGACLVLAIWYAREYRQRRREPINNVYVALALALLFVSHALTSGQVPTPDWLSRALAIASIVAIFSGLVMALRQRRRERRAVADNQGHAGGER